MELLTALSGTNELLIFIAITRGSSLRPSSNIAGTLGFAETIYHDGGIRDLSAIGTRNVGCAVSVRNWYSTENQLKIGKAYSDRLMQKARILQDPVVTENVSGIVQNIVRNSDAKIPFTVKIIESDEVNAIALPGGFFLSTPDC